MTVDRIEAIVAEYPRWGALPEDPILGALRVAIFLEDALGVTIPADRLDREHLGTAEAAVRTVRELGGNA